MDSALAESDYSAACPVQAVMDFALAERGCSVQAVMDFALVEPAVL
ncbi:MAG: hypothetical protein ACLTXT_01530 [Ruminococcus callidus]